MISTQGAWYTHRGLSPEFPDCHSQHPGWYDSPRTKFLDKKKGKKIKPARKNLRPIQETYKKESKAYKKLPKAKNGRKRQRQTNKTSVKAGFFVPHLTLVAV